VATLSVLKFNDLSGADRVLLALQGMQERQLISPLTLTGFGLSGWEWFWVILAGLFDIGQWAASYTQRNQIPGMERGG
jgi:hypothetical protein